MTRTNTLAQQPLVEQFLFDACNHPGVSDETFESLEAVLNPDALTIPVADIPRPSILRQTYEEREALRELAARAVHESDMTLPHSRQFAQKIGFSLSQLMVPQQRSA